MPKGITICARLSSSSRLAELEQKNRLLKLVVDLPHRKSIKFLVNYARKFHRFESLKRFPFPTLQQRQQSSYDDDDNNGRKLVLDWGQFSSIKSISRQYSPSPQNSSNFLYAKLSSSVVEDHLSSFSTFAYCRVAEKFDYNASFVSLENGTLEP